MKLPKLLLCLVSLLGLGVLNAGAATMGSLFVYGTGSGHAIVVGGASEYHQVWADQYQGQEAYSPEYGTTSLEQDVQCGGASTWYHSECSLTVAAGETFEFSYVVSSSGSGSAYIYVNSTLYYGNQSGSFVLGPGTYSLSCSISGGGQDGSAYANLCGWMN